MQLKWKSSSFHTKKITMSYTEGRLQLKQFLVFILGGLGFAEGTVE